MEKFIIAYIISISIVTVILTIYDKIAAKRRAFRISEATLILCAFLGGSVAELVTMLLIRHKTRHVKFMLGLPLIIILHIAVLVAVFFLMKVF